MPDPQQDPPERLDNPAAAPLPSTDELDAVAEQQDAQATRPTTD